MLFVVAALFLLPLAHFALLWFIGVGMSAGTSYGIGIGAALYFCVITWCPLTMAAVAVKRSKGILQTSLCVLASIFFGLLSLGSLWQMIAEISHR